MILITGFVPFTTGQGLVLDRNPTAEISRRIAGRVEGAQHLVLPVSFKRTRGALMNAFEDRRPRIWLGLGYAPHRKTVDFEAIALNMEHCIRADNDGEQPTMRPIESNAPLAYQTRLDLDESLAVMSASGCPSQVSLHAGAFLCNQTFFLGCHAVETHGTLDLAAFVHVPPMESYDALETGLTRVLEAL